MKNIRVLSMVLALVITLTLLAGCGEESTVQQTNEPKAENAVEYTHTDLPIALTAEKIGSVSVKRVTPCDGGAYYQGENEKYGIISLDGKHDTGAIYTSCKSEGSYFLVSTSEAIMDIKNPATLNCVGLVDANGKELIPQKYASISIINHRYVQAIEATEQTTNEDETLVFYSNGGLGIVPGEGDILFKGKWVIYDIIAGKVMEGVTGTNRYAIFSYVNILKYVTDGEEQVIINEKGEPIPAKANIFENGCYALDGEDGKGGAVYDSNNNKLFDYTEDGYKPYSGEGEYIVADKDTDATTKYVLMDREGNVVSAEFEESPSVYGDLIHAGDKVYNFEGKNIVEGTFESVYLDEQFGNAWFLKNDKNYTLIKKDGTVLYQGSAQDDAYSFDYYSDFTIGKKGDDGYAYYSFADKDFTLKGSDVAPWLVESKGDTNSIVDTLSGKTIIEGYEAYDFAPVSGSAIYVYATTKDGGIDIYLVK